MLMKINNRTYQSLADEIGKKSSTAVRNPLTRETNMRISSMKELLDAMDAELVVRTKDGKYEWVIEDAKKKYRIGRTVKDY